jgi:hypothetical protein
MVAPRPGPAVRQARLKFGPEPVELADQFAPQRPADRPGRRVGIQRLAEPVLLLVRRSQVPLQLGLQLVAGRVKLGRETAVCPDRGGHFGQRTGQPAAHVRITEGVVVVRQPGAVGQRPGEDAQRDHLVLQGLHALPQGYRAVRRQAARIELGALLRLA